MYFSSYLFKGFSLSLQFRILTQNHRSSRTIVLGLEHIICEIDAVMYITSLDLITFTIQLHNFGDVLIVSESMLRPVKISSLNSSCIFARPFAGCCCILLSVGFVNLRNFRHQRIICTGTSQRRSNPEHRQEIKPGLGSVRREERESKTLEIVNAGLH